MKRVFFPPFPYERRKRGPNNTTMRTSGCDAAANNSPGNVPKDVLLPVCAMLGPVGGRVD